MISEEAVVLISRIFNDPFESTWLNLGSQVRSIKIRRGKSSDFSDYGVDVATIEFNNHQRQFDPNYDNDFQYPENYYGFDAGFSPFPPFLPIYETVDLPWNPSEQVGERRKIKIGFGLIRQEEVRQGANQDRINARRSIFVGRTGDWEFSYTPDGDSIATLTVYGYFSVLQNDEMPLGMNRPEELASTRVDRILGSLSGGGVVFPYFAWTSDRSVVAEDATDENPLQYINLLAQSEGGAFFVDRTGKFIFQRSFLPSFRHVKLSESGIPFASIEVDFGYDLLYNDITLSNIDGTSVNVIDPNSIDRNGRKLLEISDLRTVSSNDELLTLARNYADIYSVPKFRVTSVTVNAQKFDKSIYPVSNEQDYTTSSTGANLPNGRFSQIQDDLVTLDLEDYATVSFTPNGIGEPITQTLRVIAINHLITPNNYVIEYSLSDKKQNQFILDDEVFGRLDENVLN